MAVLHDGEVVGDLGVCLETSARRVIESLGFRFERIARQAALVRGERVDNAQFAITSDAASADG